jgi:hypothetical protein
LLLILIIFSHNTNCDQQRVKNVNFQLRQCQIKKDLLKFQKIFWIGTQVRFMLGLVTSCALGICKWF